MVSAGDMGGMKTDLASFFREAASHSPLAEEAMHTAGHTRLHAVDSELLNWVLVFDVGGSHISAGVCQRRELALENVVNSPLPSRRLAQDFIELLFALCLKVAGNPDAIIGAALDFPGPFNYEVGTSLMHHKLEYLCNVNLKTAIAQRFGYAPSQVRFVNDAAAFLLGELSCLTTAQLHKTVGVTLGTGIGSAFAIEGQIVTSGPGVPDGGEIWNLPYQGSTVEERVSGKVLAADYQSRTGKQSTVAEIAMAAASDPAAREAFEQFGTRLGQALNYAVAKFCPQTIILGGGISRSADLFLPAVARELDGSGISLTVSRLSDRAPLVGAAVSWFSQGPGKHASASVTCNALPRSGTAYGKSMAQIAPFRLAPFFSPRPWGSLDLSPWYTQKLSAPIGESWLTGKDCVIDTGEFAGLTLEQLVDKYPAEILGVEGMRNHDREFPLLVKLLFPQEKLSVQIHPDDAMAQTVGLPHGKTECWYVLTAKPGAVVALGLHPGATLETIRQAVADHTLEQLLNWLPISEGDMIYVDAGTVHSIGPGSVILETQQYSDSTYRLYDYGRPRVLNVDAALRALKLRTDAGKVTPVHHQGYDELISKPYFVIERHDLAKGETRRLENKTGTVHLVVAFQGTARLQADGASAVELEPGRAIVVPGSVAEFTLIAKEDFVGVQSMPPGRMPQQQPQ